MSVLGNIVEVSTYPVGSTLATDVVSGDTRLYVEDIADFAEEGGRAVIVINDDPSDPEITYTGIFVDSDVVDVDTEQFGVEYLALSEPIDLDIDTVEDIVEVRPLPLGTEKRAEVMISGDVRDMGDTISARVPHALDALIAEGLRDAETGFESVMIVQEDGDDWVISEVIGEYAQIDAQTIVGHLPVEVLTDGIAPEEAPVVTGESFAIGAVQFSWEPVDNADPVQYRVQVGPDLSNLSDYAITSSNHVTVNTTTPVVAVVTAFDADGDGPASAPAAATPRVVDPQDLDDAITDAITEAYNTAVGAQDAANEAVRSVVTQYAVSSSETVAPTSGWSTDTPTRTPGTFVWYRAVVTYGNGDSNTSNPTILTGNTGATGSQGIQGPAGEDGTSLYTWLKYADSPTTGMSDSPDGKAYMGIAYNKVSPTESVNYGDYTWSLVKGEQGIEGPPGDDGQTTYTWVKYATSASGAGMSDDPAGKTYIGLAFNKTTSEESTTAGDYQWSLIQGPQGPAGSPAPTVTLTATTQVLVSPPAGGTTNPTTSVITGTAANTTITVRQFSVNGGTFSGTAPTGVSVNTTTNTVTVTGSTFTGRTLTVRMADANGVADTLTVAKVSDGATGSQGPTGDTGSTGAPGADAYTVLLTNEANVFAGSTSAALAGNTTTGVIAYKGTTQVPVTVGTITGQVTGLTTSIAGNNTNNPVITVAVTTSLTATKGDLTIPLTIDGKSFTKTFSWSVARQGATGSQGIQGPQGPNGQTLYTWIKYADTPTTGMSDSPEGKTYMGIAYNQTSSTESSTYGDYEWSLIRGANGSQGIQGPAGENGQPTYTWIKYADSDTGTGISDDPSGKTHIGIAYNKLTAVESSTPGDYEWSLIQGPQGPAGTPAPTVTVTATSQVLSVPTGGSTTTPATSTVTGTAVNTTISSWQYSVNGAAFSNTLPAGVSRSGNIVTITGSSMTARTIAVKMANGTGANAVADTITIAKVLDGAQGPQGDTGSTGAPGSDAYTVLLTNEAQVFAGSVSAALAGSTTTSIIAYKGTTQVPVTVGTITGQVTGLTTSITNNSTNSPTVTVNVTTSLTGTSGKLTIPLTVDGKSFTKEFSWSVARQGATGNTGSQGIQGPKGEDGQTLYTWLKYADTPTTGMSDTPDGKTYMGVAYNKTTASESSNYADYSWSLIKGADGSTGADGKGISGTTVTYQTGTSGTTAPTGTWQENPTATTTGQFLWTRTVTTYTDSSSSTAYAVSAHGATGSTGSAGRGITGTTVTYQVSSSGTVEPTGTWLTTVPATSPGQFLWTRTVTTFSAAPTSVTSYSVAAHGPQGGQGIQGPPGADGQPTYTWVKYADNSSGGGMSDDPAGKPYIGFAYNKSTQTESTTPGDYSWSLILGPQGSQGVPGTPAPVISLTATSQVLSVPATGGASNPATAVVTGSALNTTITVWQYSVNGAAFSNTVPAGVSRSGNVVTITGSSMTAKTLAVRMADANGVADTITVAKVADGAQGPTGNTGSTGAAGADAYTVILSNESQVFPGSTTAALAGTATTSVIAYKGATQQSATIGTITGQVTGLTTAITNNGTNNATVTITVTSSLTATNGTLNIPVTVDGKTFTKVFSWSVSRQGVQGSQGIQGPPGSNGQSLYTWIKYADSPTTGMSDLPAGKTYMGIAYNKTTSSESSSYGDYEWTLIQGPQGNQGIQGPAGSDGQPTYTWIKYADNASGGGISDSPVGKTYLGIAYNKTTPSESSTPGDYEWTLIQGPQGPQGNAGTPAAMVSVTATSQVMSVPATGGATNPTTVTVTGTAVNTTITVWQYSVNGAAFSNTLPTGVTRSGNVVTITGASMTAKTITVRMANAAGIADTITVAKVADGAQGPQGNTGNTGSAGSDAYTVLLSNEAHVFPGSTTAALAGAVNTSIIAYKGATQQNATIGTITGAPTGMSTSVTGSGTNNPAVAVIVTTSLTATSGVLTIPVTVDGKTFNKTFSWSVSRQGATGSTGNTGATGTSVTSVTPYFYKTAEAASAPSIPTTNPPPSPWTTTEPDYTPNTALWRTERILFSNSTFSYTAVTKVSSYTAAVTAVTTANGKNKSMRSTGNPTGTGFVLGDQWWKYSGSQVVGFWTHDGTNWQPQTLTDSVITNLDAGSITAGTLNAERIGADSITVSKLLVSDLTNVVDDPRFIRPLATYMTPESTWNVGGTWTVNDRTAMPWTGAGRVATLTTAAGGAWQYISPKQFTMTRPGDTWYISFMVCKRTTGGTGTIALTTEYDNPQFPTHLSTLDISTMVTNTWYKLEASFDTPPTESLTKMGFWSQTTSAGIELDFTDFMMRKSASAELIVDGSITGRKIAANAITADKMSANYVYAKEIEGTQIRAGSLQADKFAAELVHAGTIATAAEGQRVVLGTQGVELFDSNGASVTRISWADSKFTGEVYASRLETEGGAVLRGETKVGGGARIILGGAVIEAPTLPLVYAPEPLRRVPIGSPANRDWVIGRYLNGTNTMAACTERNQLLFKSVETTNDGKNVTRATPAVATRGDIFGTNIDFDKVLGYGVYSEVGSAGTPTTPGGTTNEWVTLLRSAETTPRFMISSVYTLRQSLKVGEYTDYTYSSEFRPLIAAPVPVGGISNLDGDMRLTYERTNLSAFDQTDKGILGIAYKIKNAATVNSVTYPAGSVVVEFYRPTFTVANDKITSITSLALLNRVKISESVTGPLTGFFTDYKPRKADNRVFDGSFTPPSVNNGAIALSYTSQNVDKKVFTGFLTTQTAPTSSQPSVSNTWDAYTNGVGIGYFASSGSEPSAGFFDINPDASELRIYTGEGAGYTDDNVYYSYTYRNTSGSRETTLAPLFGPVKIQDRVLSRWTVPAAPAGVESIYIYDSPNPNRTNFWPVAEIVAPVAGVPNTKTQMTTPIPSEGSPIPPPAVSTYSFGSNSGSLISSNGLIEINGDGTTKVPTPTQPQHIANKEYIDSLVTPVIGGTVENQDYYEKYPDGRLVCMGTYNFPGMANTAQSFVWQFPIQFVGVKPHVTAIGESTVPQNFSLGLLDHNYHATKIRFYRTTGSATTVHFRADGRWK